MKNKKNKSIVPLIFLNGLALFSLIYNLVNSHATTKIIASLVGFLGLLGLTIFLYMQIKKQEKIKNIDYEK